jgi:hypothetical protein
MQPHWYATPFMVDQVLQELIDEARQHRLRTLARLARRLERSARDRDPGTAVRGQPAPNRRSPATDHRSRSAPGVSAVPGTVAAWGAHVGRPAK